MTTQTAPLIKFQDNHPPESDFFSEVMDGLLASPKRIEPKFFYDEKGSRLFDDICQTPEYYPTRTETAIIEANLDAISKTVGRGCLLLEPGSGNSAKVRKLLEAVHPYSYLPMDISKSYLRQQAQKLAAEFPWLDVHAVCSDFSGAMAIPHYPEDIRRVAFFPGSSIGNFDPEDATGFLSRLRTLVGDTGGLLIGVDLKKDTDTLNAAYNDAAGITAAFNMNLLTRINNELGANFDIAAFHHKAFFNTLKSRIEMHLVSQKVQTVTLSGMPIRFGAGESIHTENSYKYTPAEFRAIARKANFDLETYWTDEREWFGLFYFRSVAA